MYGTNPITKSLLDKIKNVMTEDSTNKVDRKDSIKEAYAKMISEGYKKIDETFIWQNANPAPVEDEYFFEAHEINDDVLEEGEGNLKGLSSHFKKIVTGSKFASNVKGGEHSPITDHGRVISHSNFRGKLSDAMKSHNSVHVVHVDGKPVASVHTQYHGSGVRPEYNVNSDKGTEKVKRSRHVPGTGRHYGGQYVPYKEHHYETASMNKDNTLNKVIHGIVKHHLGGADMDDKSTYKAHHIEIKSYGADKKRAEKMDSRKAAKNDDGDTLKQNREKAINKMADKHVSSSGPLEKTKELHKAVGDAIAKGDHAALRHHLSALSDHTRYKDSLSDDSYDKHSYKDSLKHLSSKSDDWYKKMGRDDLNRLKEKGVVKEEVELSQEEIALLEQIASSFEE